jgi:exodeoxyribonuclease VII large subunit
MELLEGYRHDMDITMEKTIDRYKHSLNEKYLGLKAMHPGKILEQRKDRLNHIREMLNQKMNAMLLQTSQDMKRKEEKIHTQMSHSLENVRYRLSIRIRALDEASPLKKMSAGYTYAADESGHGIKSVERIQTGDMVKLYFVDGTARAEIRETKRSSQNDHTGNIE